MSYSFIQAEKRQYPVAVLPYHGCSAQWILCLVPATARRRAEQNQSLLDQIQGTHRGSSGSMGVPGFTAI
jgi:hypothetical protein